MPLREMGHGGQAVAGRTIAPMEIFLAHLWDELDELQGLAWHGAVAVAADLRSLARSVCTALGWLRS
jgi:hypothetical protein